MTTPTPPPGPPPGRNTRPGTDVDLFPDNEGSLELRPVNLKEANEFVTSNHRHHKKVQGHKFSLSAFKNGVMVGVAIVGRPVSRHLDDGMTLEVTRLCTEGSRNACSFLYGACWRAAKALGYKRLVTYTLTEESGTSLRGVAWKRSEEPRRQKNWSCPSRPRTDSPDLGPKWFWEITAGGYHGAETHA